MTTLLAPAKTGRPDRLAGLGTMLRFGLRRERLALSCWVAALVVTVLSSISAIAGLYPTVLDRSQLAQSIALNPSFLALTGPVTATSIGGVTAWRIAVLAGVAVALMGTFTVIRRTRADEESGRAELVLSGVIGRDTLLTAALLVAWGATVLVGVLSALGGVANGLPAAGSLAMGAALAGPGLVFVAAAGVCAQIFENGRTATATAGGLLAASFALRAVGDLWSPGRWLSWLSPLGWSQKVDAFGANRWWVLLLFVVLTAALTGVAVGISHRRDVGLGLFPTRLGPTGNQRLRSGLALAIRLQRGSWVGWAVGFLYLGLLTGSLATSAGSLLSDNPKIQQLMVDLGGAGTLSDEMFAAMSGIGALAAGAYAVSAALRVRSEETAGRADAVLSTGLSRSRWFAGHLLFSLAGSASLMAVAGLSAGMLHGITAGDVADGLRVGLFSMTVEIPAVLVIGGVAAMLVGLVPQLAAASWGVLGLAALLGQLGKLLGLPRFVMDLSPYTHIPVLPIEPMRWTPVVFLLLVAAATVGAAFAGIRRRNIG